MSDLIRTVADADLLELVRTDLARKREQAKCVDWSYDERSHRVEIDTWTPQVPDASCEILASRDPGLSA